MNELDGYFKLSVRTPREDVGHIKTSFDPRIASSLKFNSPETYGFNLQKIMDNNLQYSDEIVLRYLQEDDTLLIPHSSEIQKKLSQEEWFELRHAFLIKTYNCIYRERIPDELYWGYVSLLWTHHKIHMFDVNIYKELFFAARPNRFRYLMNQEDKDLYLALPHKITVYRGCQEGYEQGWSYTTNYEIAKWFALRKQNYTKPRIVHATVYKKDIVAYFNERDEAEILATKYKNCHIETLEHIPDYNVNLIDLVKELS